MDNFLKIILVLYLLLCPFYIFDSGLPQPADMLVAFGGFIFVFSGKTYQLYKSDPILKYFFRFILLVVVINLFYWFYLEAFTGVKNKIYFTPIFYVFNTLFFVITLYTLKSQKKDIINAIALFVMISIFIQCVLGILGISKGLGDEGARATIFFNNPNQLGYYSLLMLCIFATLNSKYRQNKFYVLIVVAMTVYLILYSGSRAALGGALLLSAMIFFKEGFKLSISSAVLVLALILSLPVIIKSDFIQNKIMLIERRNDRDFGTGVTELEVRGYDRFYLHPEYVFYGAGEGHYQRFNSFHDKEIHSGIGTIIFSYGIFGFFLFVIFVYNIIKANLLYNILLITPLIIYNVTHNGLRFSLLWMVFVIIYVQSTKSKVLLGGNEPARVAN